MSNKNNTSNRRNRRGRANNKGAGNDGKNGSYTATKAGKALAKIWGNPLQLSLATRNEIADRMALPPNSDRKLIAFSQKVPFVSSARNRCYDSATASQPFNFVVVLMTMLGLTLKSMVDAKSIVNVIVTLVRTLATALNMPFNEVQVKKAVQLRVMGVEFKSITVADLISSFGIRDIDTVTYGAIYGAIIRWLENSQSGMVISPTNTTNGLRVYYFDANVVGDMDSDAFYTAMPVYVVLYVHDPIDNKIEFNTMETPDMPKNFFGTTIIRHDIGSKAESMIADLTRTGEADATPFNLDKQSTKTLVGNGLIASAQWGRTVATIDGHKDVSSEIDASVTEITKVEDKFRRIVRKDYSPAAKANTFTRQPALAGTGSSFNA